MNAHDFVAHLRRKLEEKSMAVADVTTASLVAPERYMQMVGYRRGLKEAISTAQALLDGSERIEDEDFKEDKL